LTIRIPILLFFCLGAFSRTNGETGLTYQPPLIGQFHPLEPGGAQPSILTERHPRYLSVKTSLIEERQVVDFEQRAVAFERVDKAFGVIIWQYRYNEMDDYIADREKFAFAGLWLGGNLDRFKAAAEKKKNFNPLQMELNIQYPSWAQRILGKDPPKLSITGYEEIIVSYEYNKTDAAGSNYDQKGNGGLNFDQENQFTVNGSVGRLINVNIKASTKKGVDASDANDPFKNFKIEYKGEGNELEDEVVQEVSAGAMSFQMPGASLAGYSESHQGLLGLKVKTKFGPVELTGIASQERGEAQKTSFDLVNGSGGNSVIADKDFQRYKLFFLDTLYLKAFLRNREKIPDGKKIDRRKLQVWLHSEQQTQLDLSNAALKGKAKFCYYGTSTPFRLLVEGKDYSVYELVDGCIRFDSTIVQETDQIGICMATSDMSLIKGDTLPVQVDTTIPVKNLWILKTNMPSATDSTFSLAWRNTYQLPSDFDASKFKLQVKTIPESGDTTDRVGSTLISSILGLTDNTGTPYSTDKSIYDNDAHLLLIPPYKIVETGIISNQPFANPALISDKVINNPGLYTKTQDSLTQLKPRFNIIMSGSTRKTQFQLGSGNIMEKSEKVKGQDGEELARDVDYTLDYQFGTLNLTSKKALSKTRVDVEYQSEALFIPKSKVFLGLHGEMKLPFGLNSFVGASILYQSAAGQALIPKIGQEPYSKVLLDANTKMDFEPQWMTALMNRIPLLTTEEKSTASLDIEVANSRTNPNTDGQAYIDDFESSNRSFDLGLDERSWYQAAPPGYLVNSSTPDSTLLHCPPAWTQWWYQPQSYTASSHDARVLKDSLFYKLPYKRTYTNDDKYEPVLNFECQPAPAALKEISPDSNIAQRYIDNNLNPWAGIMYPIPSSSMNRTQDKFLEFYARGTGGRLYVDMGELSEDLCFLGGPPNHRPGNEDTSNTGTGSFNEDLNIGVDGLPDKKEYCLVPAADGKSWDILRYLDRRLQSYAGDPGKDNYQTYSVTTSGHPEYANNYPYVNGKEKNGQPYDSKDLLGDGLSTTENYFRRFIDFDSVNTDKDFIANARNYKVLPDSSLGNTKAQNGWHLYRIPLNDTLIGHDNFFQMGKPRWDRIRFIRLFWTDFNPAQRPSKDNRIQFARMRLVRNEWQEQPVRVTDSISVVKLTASTINTEDNPEYRSPPSFAGTTDESGNIMKETSLKLDFTDIRPGDTALVKNILVNQSINLSSYTTMSMFVHGDPLLKDDENFQFFFRFGNDDSTYYEYRAPLYSGGSSTNNGWDSRNNMNINLHDFSRWKQKIMGDNPPISKDSVESQGAYTYSIKYRNSRPPNFAGVTWMAIGVTRLGPKNSLSEGYKGVLWVDELKVQGVHNFNGWATRASLNTSWAGFMNIGARVDYTGADFQQMTATDMKLGNTNLTGNAQASWALNKFLPAQWGVNIPLGTSVSSSITRPTLVQNTDVYLTNTKTDKADGFLDMYKDYINMLFGKDLLSNQKPDEAKHYQTSTVSRTFYTGFDKSSSSKNPLVNMLLERLSLDYNYNFNLTQTARGRRSDNANVDYVDSNQTDRYTGNIKYDLSPRPAPAWTKWKPFEGSKLSFLPERFKNYELSLLPTTMNFTLAEVTYGKTKDIKDNPANLGGKTTISTRNLTLMHNATFAYDPINILKANYTININRNLDNDINDPRYALGSSYTQWKNIFNQKIAHLDPTWHKFLVLADERDRTQNTSLNFDPTLWDWLTLSGDYSANYKQNTATLQNDPTNYLNLGLTSTFHLTSTLTVATLFKKLSEGLANHKAMAAVFGSIEKGLGKLSLNSFSFNYNASLSLTNNYWDEPYVNSRGVSRMNFLKYQLGLSGRNAWDIVTAGMDDKAFGGMRYRNGYHSSTALQTNDKEDRRASDRSYSFSTSFALPEPIGVSISNLGLKYSMNYGLQPDTAYRDTTITWPEIDVAANTKLLNKIKLITRYLQDVNLNSGYNFQKKVQIKYSPSTNDVITSLSSRFSPLVGIDGKFKKLPVNMSYSLTYNTTSEASRINGRNDNSEYINKMTLSYELQKSNDVSEFKLLLWTIPLKGTFSVGVDGELGGTQSTQSSSSSTAGQPTEQSTSHWSFGPHSSYTVSENITGNLSFSASQNKKESVTTTSYIFKLSVNIALK
jgi:hypothetical protein